MSFSRLLGTVWVAGHYRHNNVRGYYWVRSYFRHAARR